MLRQREGDDALALGLESQAHVRIVARHVGLAALEQEHRRRAVRRNEDEMSLLVRDAVARAADVVVAEVG